MTFLFLYEGPRRWPGIGTCIERYVPVCGKSVSRAWAATPTSHPRRIAAGVIAGAALLTAAPALAAPPAPAAARAGTSNGLCAVPKASPSFWRGPVVMEIRNNTDKTLRVRICGNHGKGLRDEKVRPGDALMGSGKATELYDLKANVIYPKGMHVNVWGKNPAVGRPHVGVGAVTRGGEGFSVGDSKTFTQYNHSFTVIRHYEGHGDSKRFKIRVNS